MSARHPYPVPDDTDELSGGNIGFEALVAPTPAEQREYMYGLRTGMAQGLIGGALLGALIGGGIVAFAVWAGVQAGLGAL